MNQDEKDRLKKIIYDLDHIRAKYTYDGYNGRTVIELTHHDIHRIVEQLDGMVDNEYTYHFTRKLHNPPC